MKSSVGAVSLVLALPWFTLAAHTFTSTAFVSPGATITEVCGIHDDGVSVFHSTMPSLPCRWGDDSALTLDPHQVPCAWGGD